MSDLYNVLKDANILRTKDGTTMNLSDIFDDAFANAGVKIANAANKTKNHVDTLMNTTMEKIINNTKINLVRYKDGIDGDMITVHPELNFNSLEDCIKYIKNDDIHADELDKIEHDPVVLVSLDGDEYEDLLEIPLNQLKTFGQWLITIYDYLDNNTDCYTKVRKVTRKELEKLLGGKFDLID